MINPGMIPPVADMEPWGDEAGIGPVGTGGPGSVAEAQALWRERERRQRTVRFLVMFLLMLLLMDGEEKTQRRRSQDPRLRKRLRMNGRNGKYYLDQSLYKQRVNQDKRIEAISTTHPRYSRLVQKNKGENVELVVRTWADQQAELQEDEFVVPAGDVQREDQDPEHDRVVFHYPWNATGFYRGQWVRDLPQQEASNDSKGETSIATNKRREQEEARNKDSEKSMDHKTSKTLNTLKSAVEMESQMLKILEDTKETIGVYLLPQQLELKLPNATPAIDDGRESLADGKGNMFTSYQHQTPNLRAHIRNEESDIFVPHERMGEYMNNNLQITLSKSTGRTAFQLYSRAIPAMKELTLLDGFVKLYDSNTVGYSTRKDLLLRVSGVLVHSIGRISLVSNAALGRSALVISKTEEQDKQHRHRRLLGSIASAIDSIHDADAMEQHLMQIRDDALALHSPPNNLLNSRYDEQGGWTLSTPDFGLFREAFSVHAHVNDEYHRRLSSDQTDVPAVDTENLGTSENVSIATSSKDLTKKSSNETKVNQDEEESLPSSRYVIPYPFVPDDEELSIRKTRTPAARKMPPREQLLEANAGGCEFEINMDVQEEEWTLGQWRSLVSRYVKQAFALDPSNHGDSVDEDEEASTATESGLKHSSKHSDQAAKKPLQDQALVMIMKGSVVSPNCHFAATLNATAIRTDWEHTTGKAINYSFQMMLTCLTQIVVLLRQLLHTQSQSAATRVSLLCIGWQTVLDALLCLVHIYLSLAMQPLFTAFASVAFFKLLIFCVIEMKYMAIIIQARNANNGGNSLELLRRQIAMLHLRFYVALIFAFVTFFYAGEKYRTLYILVLYSFWVPQIVQNVITEAKRPLHNYYIYGMSWTRLVAPVYIFAVPKNFLKEVYPDSPTNPFMCQLLFLWIAIQTAVLIAQGRYGARFMIPARFLPPKFDYSRPIPPSLLPPEATIVDLPAAEELRNDRSNGAGSHAPSLLSTQDNGPNPTAIVGARNRIKGSRCKRSESGMTAETVTPERAEQNLPRIDCVICYNAIDVRNRRGYMLAPCDHLFHRECLVQWMDVKMECPICRTELPTL